MAIPWWRLPTILAVPKLIRFRNELRQKNLHDTEDRPLDEGIDPIEKQPLLRFKRTDDGTYNDLKQPRMGAAGTRFGRNFPLKECFPDEAKLMTPNPRDVSLALMTRDKFQGVPFLNLLAAAWIQFQVHDWFAHGRDEQNPKWFEIALRDDDPWPARPMKVPPTPADPTYDPASGKPPTFKNQNSHWWDGSQIYGTDPATCASLRTGVDGKLKVDPEARLPLNPETGIDLTGFIDNWWVGMSLLHGLFAAEHNVLCDEFKKRNPGWTDEHLYVKSRLVVAALMAKIHTIEWTPAILPNETTQLAMRVNWHGVSGGLQKALKFLDDSELLGGIVGSSVDHHTAPYSLTEEFTSVYRMHSLMPDDFTFRSLRDDRILQELPLPEIAGRKSRAVFDSMSVADQFYSFSRMQPGMIRLHNFPKHLQFLTRDNGQIFDMAAVDILRDRERGVPRYNRFRELLRMPRIERFEDLTDNKVWAEQIRQVYNNRIDDVDLQVGLQCEPLPDGFGFSETAFRIFVLMASRRLKSDRFFTDDYTPEMYTQFGLDWIDKNSMKTVLLRHHPSLSRALDGVKNAFHPWKQAKG
jgi:hypothetical protein